MKLLLVLCFLSPPDTTLKVESVQLNLSTLGGGLEGSFRFTAKPVSIRAGLNYIAFKKPLQFETAKDSYLNVQPDLYSGHVYLLGDYHFLRKRWLRATAGLAYAPLQRYATFLDTDGDLKLGEMTIPENEFGNTDLEIRWNRLKPYLGLGLGRQVMRKRMGLGLEVGVFFLLLPRLRLNYEGFLETTTIDEEIDKIQRNMRGYRFYPYVSIQVKYRVY